MKACAIISGSTNCAVNRARIRELFRPRARHLRTMARTWLSLLHRSIGFRLRDDEAGSVWCACVVPSNVILGTLVIMYADSGTGCTH